MSPAVIAAIIAASASILTLIGTLTAQYLGRRATSRDTEKTLEEQGKHLDRTLEQQREQLDRTLTEQSKQLDRTLAEQRTRTLNERFATAADKLGSDKPPAVRLAGVYAMAGLADDWPENRQTCVDVLCAYLRLPYEPDPGDRASAEKRLRFRASREVRHTVIRVISAHLEDGAAVSWQGLRFDLTGVVFDGGSFSGTMFSGGEVIFNGAVFSSGSVFFRGAKFSGGEVLFHGAEFSGSKVFFAGAEFSGSKVDFTSAEFSAGRVYFDSALFSGDHVSFQFAEFSGSEVLFHRAEFSGGQVNFSGAEFSGGEVSFSGAEFSGGEVSFSGAKFSGGQVDFSRTADWTHRPEFDWDGTPPPGVKLPIPIGRRRGRRNL